MSAVSSIFVPTAIHKCEYEQLEKLLRAHLPLAADFSIVSNEEWDNDETYSFLVGDDNALNGDELDDIDVVIVEKREIEEGDFSLADMLDYLAIRKHVVPYGELMVEVCW